MSLRGLGIGVASNILFGLMEARKPEFAYISEKNRWNRFESFKLAKVCLCVDYLDLQILLRNKK